MTSRGLDAPAESAPVVYYALGGGLGHLTRSIAILRQMVKRGLPDCVALSNSPHHALYAAEGVRSAWVSPETGQPAGALAEWVMRQLARWRPQLLVVDVFPRGLLGELPPVLGRFAGRTALVLRRLREGYARECRLREFAAAHYDVVLAAEALPGAPWAGRTAEAMSVGPVLVRDADELLSRDGARRLLGAAVDRLLVVCVESGPGEPSGALHRVLSRVWERLGRRFDLRLVGSGGAESHYPLIELLPGVDLVVGAGGYNLFHECQAVGVPAVFVPQRRRYDEQFARVAAATVASSPEHLESILAAHVAAGPTPRPAPHYRNGAGSAAGALLGLLAASDASIC